MKRILFLSFFIVGLLIASEPGVAGSASSAKAPECPICMQPVDLILSADNPEAAVTTTPLFGCNHPETFHANCLAHLLETRGVQTTCPICRNPLLAHPGPNLPIIIQAALPGHQAAGPAQQVVAPIQAAPAVPIIPAHVTHINQIMHRYNAGAERLDLVQLNINMIDGAVFEQINERWPNLRRFDLSFTPLAVLPAEIGNLHNLQRLNLSNNPLLAVLPPEIGNLHNLQVLNLSNDPSLEALPAEIGNLHNLQVLHLSNDSLLEALPVEIGNLHDLAMLDLNNTHLAVLFPEIGQLHNLQWLYLSNTNLEVLPPEIGQLHNLEMLNLSSNPLLAALPPEIGQLQHLREIDLSNTPLIHNANWPARCVQLQHAIPQLRILE